MYKAVLTAVTHLAILVDLDLRSWPSGQTSYQVAILVKPKFQQMMDPGRGPKQGRSYVELIVMNSCGLWSSFVDFDRSDFSILLL